MAKLTPSTAFTHVDRRPSSPRRTGKYFFSPRASRTGEDIVQQPAAGNASVAEVEVRRLFRHAAGHGLGAAGMEGAARGQAGEVGRLARDRVERLLAAELRHRAQQGARVRVLGGI